MPKNNESKDNIIVAVSLIEIKIKFTINFRNNFW